MNNLTWQLAFLAFLICMKKVALPCPAHMDQQCWQLVKRSLSFRDDVPLGSPSLQLWLPGFSYHCSRTSQNCSKPAFAKAEAVTWALQDCQVKPWTSSISRHLLKWAMMSSVCWHSIVQVETDRTALSVLWYSIIAACLDWVSLQWRLDLFL